MSKRIAYVAPADRAAAGQAITATALCESQRHGLCPGRIVSATSTHGQRCRCACHRSVGGMTLVEQVDHLRGLAEMERGTTVLQLAMLNVLGAMAEAVDRLTDQQPPERGFGSI